MQRSEQRAGDTGGKDAEPGRAALEGHGVAGHGAEDERAFEAEIDPPRFLGQALTEADEEERRRHPDGTGEHGKEDDVEAGFSVHQRSSLGAEEGQAAVEGVADQQDDEHQALQDRDGRVRQSHAPLDEAAGGGDTAEEERHRNDRQRVLPGEERDQNAGKAVAGGDRGIGPP